MTAHGRRWPLLAAALVALPMLAVLAAIVQGATTADAGLWRHLAGFVLPRVAANTALLVVAVVAVALLLGSTLAWLTAACDFPGRGFFAWALLLPMAVPAYVLAFVAIATLDFAGPVSTALRGLLGPDFRLPPIRSTGGTVAVLVLAFYPYVYLLARGAFLTHGTQALEAARSLGYGPWAGFLWVALPLARPWLAAGAGLVTMETLADFGAVSVFNFDTFTTAIYKSWHGLFSLGTAMSLALVLLAVVALALACERLARGRARHAAGGAARAAQRLRLAPLPAALAAGYAGVVFLLGFGLPVLALAGWALDVARADLDPRYLEYVLRTLLLAAAAALACTLLAALLGYAGRARPGTAVAVLARAATLGYAVPGTVLAAGVAGALGVADASWRALAGGDGLWLAGTVGALLLGYVARFLAVADGPVGAGFSRLRPALDEAAHGLGCRGPALFGRVHLPLLGAGLGTAVLLVFVDVMKEMPLTLMTRPFGWDTLAVRVFELTSEGEWERAALPAIVIVLAGLLPVVLLTRRIEHAARGA